MPDIDPAHVLPEAVEAGAPALWAAMAATEEGGAYWPDWDADDMEPEEADDARQMVRHVLSGAEHVIRADERRRIVRDLALLSAVPDGAQAGLGWLASALPALWGEDRWADARDDAPPPPASDEPREHSGTGQPTRACCDMHNTNCEPPSELCCGGCTEAGHGIFGHRDGTACVLDAQGDAAERDGDGS